MISPHACSSFIGVAESVTKLRESSAYKFIPTIYAREASVIKRDLRGLLHFARIFVEIPVSFVLLLLHRRPKFHQFVGNLLICFL